MTVGLSFSERMRLLQYATDLKKSGHWGNSDFLTPESEILYHKIEKSEKAIDISITEIDALINWIKNSTATGQILNHEDITIINKIYNSVKVSYNEMVSDYNINEKRLLKIADLICEIHEQDDKYFKTIKNNIKQIDVESINKSVKSLESQVNGISKKLDFLIDHVNEKDNTEKISFFKKIKLFQKSVKSNLVDGDLNKKNLNAINKIVDNAEKTVKVLKKIK